MKLFLKRTTSLALLAMIGALGFAQMPAQTNGAESAAMRFKGIDGKAFDIADERGNVVVLSFGATWCTPCAAELVVLDQIRTEYKGKPVKFYWVSVESKTDASDSKLRDYGKSLKMSIPILRDPLKEMFFRFSNRVRLPMVVFIDKDGQFSGPVQIGMSTAEDVYRNRVTVKLNQLLEQPSAAGQTK